MDWNLRGKGSHPSWVGHHWLCSRWGPLKTLAMDLVSILVHTDLKKKKVEKNQLTLGNRLKTYRTLKEQPIFHMRLCSECLKTRKHLLKCRKKIPIIFYCFINRNFQKERPASSTDFGSPSDSYLLEASKKGVKEKSSKYQRDGAEYPSFFFGMRK